MRRRVLVRSLCALALVAFCGATATPPRAATAADAAAAPVIDPRRRTPIVDAVERARPAVVNISAEEVVFRRDPVFDQFFRDFFELRPPERKFTRTSLGSGVIVNAEGFVVTNAHVVARGQRIRVVLADERELEAKLVGTDTDADLAVLAVAATDLPFVPFGTASDLMIGESVIAIGNPFGFSHTVTTGVVSATHRSLRTPERTFFDFIQTDASINPGNSGGPLLDATGELIGINTAIYGGAQNIGFAIPAERAAEVVHQLITHGEVRPGWLGFAVQDLDPDLAAALGVETGRGVLVRWVEADGPAAAAGLVRGDVVVEIEGRKPESAQAVDDRLTSLPEGGQLELRVLRQGRDEPLELSLVAEILTPERLDGQAWQRLGIRANAGRAEGPLVLTAIRPKSGAARAGIRAGDHLLAIEDIETRSRADLHRALRRLRRAERAHVAVEHEGMAYRLAIPLD